MSLKDKVGPLLIGDRPLPHSLDAEKAVLGCALTEPKLIAEAATRLGFGGAFYSAAHQSIYEVLVSMEMGDKKRAIDPITVVEELKVQDLLESVGGEATVLEMMNIVPTTANFENYISIVHDYAVLRRLIRTSSDTVQKCFEADSDVNVLVDKIQQEILQVSDLQAGKDSVPVGDLVKDAVEYIMKLHDSGGASAGIPTGYKDLDKLITGLKPAEMFVLAARPSIGKTTFALNVAANVALRADTPQAVGVFSLEMPSDALTLRLLSSEARINMRDVKGGHLTHTQWAEVIQHAEKLKSAPIYIDDTGQLDIIELRAKARRMKDKHDIQFLVIDYLQLMRATGGNSQTNREQEVAQMSGGIKALAKELNIPIMILAQLNRQAEQSGARPKLSNLRESGAIEQDADVVALLHRDRDEMIEGDRDAIARRGVECELIIAKNRNGEVGSAPLIFFPAYTIFEDRSPVADEDVPSTNF